MDDLVVRDGLAYREFTKVPFSGEISGKETGKIKNGKKIGVWIKYHKNGQLMISQDSTVSHNTLNYCVISVTHRLTEQTNIFESSINTLLMFETASQVQILLRLEA